VAEGFVVRGERPEDRDAVAGVICSAFAGEPEVADLVAALRRSTAWRPELSLVAAGPRDEVVGHVLATRAWLDAPDRLVDVLLLSPLSVAPARQRQGVGGRLVRALLERAADRPEPAVFLEGSPAYYGRFGFGPAGRDGIRRPSLRIPEPAFQVWWRSRRSPGLSGTLVYPDPFWELDCVGLR